MHSGNEKISDLYFITKILTQDSVTVWQLDHPSKTDQFTDTQQYTSHRKTNIRV